MERTPGETAGRPPAGSRRPGCWFRRWIRGLRLAVPTMAWAARWMTVSVWYSPMARSRRSRSRTSPRTTRTRSMARDRTNSDCGTQSRTTHDHFRAGRHEALSQPSRPTDRLRRSPEPGGPARSRRSFPDLPGGRVGGPQLVEVLVLAKRVHGVEEAFMPVGHELAVERPGAPRARVQRCTRRRRPDNRRPRAGARNNRRSSSLRIGAFR